MTIQTDLKELMKQDVQEASATMAAVTVTSPHSGVATDQLPRLLHVPVTGVHQAETPEPETFGDPNCCLRLSRNMRLSSLMMERANGECFDIPYSRIDYTMMPIKSSAYETLMVYGAGHEISIIGKELRFLRERIATCQVYAITQKGAPHPEYGTTIKSIAWKSLFAQEATSDA
jgi:hypothetical protein